MHFVAFTNVDRTFSSRCLTEAWSVIRQHSSRFNMGELLGFLYESCQELGLIKELMKLPLMPNEQARKALLSITELLLIVLLSIKHFGLCYRNVWRNISRVQEASRTENYWWFITFSRPTTYLLYSSTTASR